MSGHKLDANLTTLHGRYPAPGMLAPSRHITARMPCLDKAATQRLGSEANPRHRIGSHLCTKVAPETL